jgi:hypothetical protein
VRGERADGAVGEGAAGRAEQQKQRPRMSSDPEFKPQMSMPSDWSVLNLQAAAPEFPGVQGLSHAPGPRFLSSSSRAHTRAFALSVRIECWNFLTRCPLRRRHIVSPFIVCSVSQWIYSRKVLR